MSNTFKRNLVTSTDSYKISHPHQFQENATFASYYAEARGGNFHETMIAGMHFLTRVISNGISLSDVERANMLFKSHFGRDLFVYESWKRIVTEFGGFLPIDLYGVREGTVVPVHNAVMVCENTHPDYVYLGGHLETFLLRGVWYPSTVATISYNAKKVISESLDRSSDLAGSDRDFVLKTRLHDFGARGVSSEESASIGDLAHLINFVGTDTVEGLIMAQDLYNLSHDFAAGISIPAREHTTTIIYGDRGQLTPDQEDEAFENSMDKFGDMVYACVMDSVNFEAAVKRVCKKYKTKIIDLGGKFVFRPDSGNKFHNIGYLLRELSETFGYTVNSKGFKVLHPSVGIIQGDDISNVGDIIDCLELIEKLGFSTENVAYGMGGGLLQHCNRDTCKWAYKCSAVMVDGVWREVRKNPKGAEWKASKAGRLRLVKIFDEYQTVNILDPQYAKYEHDNEFVKYVSNGRSNIEFNESLFVSTRNVADSQLTK